jgi:hypothetical protein
VSFIFIIYLSFLELLRVFKGICYIESNIAYNNRGFYIDVAREECLYRSVVSKARHANLTTLSKNTVVVGFLTETCFLIAAVWFINRTGLVSERTSI